MTKQMLWLGNWPGIDGTTITDAVIAALKETIDKRTRQETPRETARRILEKRRLAFRPDRMPVPPEAYHDFDHSLGDES